MRVMSNQAISHTLHDAKRSMAMLTKLEMDEHSKGLEVNIDSCYQEVLKGVFSIAEMYVPHKREREIENVNNIEEAEDDFDLHDLNYEAFLGKLKEHGTSYAIEYENNGVLECFIYEYEYEHIDQAPPRENRGRGRPMKQVREIEREDDIIDQSRPSGNRGRGRPRKQVREIEGENNFDQGQPSWKGAHEALPSEKRECVRQRKQVIENELDNVDQASISQRRGRGRPRKCMIEIECKNNIDQTRPSDRGSRGCPRKINMQNECENVGRVENIDQTRPSREGVRCCPRKRLIEYKYQNQIDQALLSGNDVEAQGQRKLSKVLHEINVVNRNDCGNVDLVEKIDQTRPSGQGVRDILRKRAIENEDQPSMKVVVQDQRKLKDVVKNENVVNGNYKAKGKAVSYQKHGPRNNSVKKNHLVKKEMVRSRRRTNNVVELEGEYSCQNIAYRSSHTLGNSFAKVQSGKKAARDYKIKRHEIKEENAGRYERDSSVVILDNEDFLQLRAFVGSKVDKTERSNVPSEYRERVLNVLKKPYDKDEYRKHREAVGSYIDYYPDLKCKLRRHRYKKEKVLNILRGFFFWLEKVTQKESFRPWMDRECLAVEPQLK